MPSSVFGGKNSNEKTGFRSSRISSIRMREGYARAPVLLLGRDDVEVGGDLRPAGQRVLDVDRVVLAVGAEQAEEDAGPADAAELALLLEGLREREGVPVELVVDALGLRHAVHEDAVRRLGAARQRHHPALVRVGHGARVATAASRTTAHEVARPPGRPRRAMLRHMNLNVRFSTESEPVQRLASLAGETPPHGPVLLAEVDDEPVAAIAIADGRSIADPRRSDS